MLRRFLYLFLALVVVWLVGMAWYVSNKGFTRKWRKYIVQEFRKAGVEIHIRRLTLDPFRGLVAKEVRVLDARDRKRVLAWIDEMLLGVNYASAVRGEPFLDSADLRDANLWLPLDAKNPDGPKVEISKLNARFFLPPKQIYLARAQAEIHGIQVFATGRLINPQAWQPRASGSNAVVEAGAEVLEELAKLRYGSPPPTLTLEFSGDLAHPEQVQADLRFDAKEVRRKNYEFKSIGLVASCRKGVIEIQQFHAVDPRGELRATGTYDLESHEIAVRGHSSLDLDEVDRAFRWFPSLGDWELSEPPQLEINLTGKLAPSPVLRMTGHADLHRSAYRRIPFKNLSTSFSWENDAWSLRDFHLIHQAGEMTGDVTCQPGAFRAKLHCTLNPTLFAGLLQPEQAEWLERFDFPTPPALRLELRGPEPALEKCEAQGQLTYERVLYQGLPAAPASSTLRIANRVLSIAPFTLEKDAAAGPAQLLFDFARHEVRVEKAPPASPAVE